ncbi:MAG: porin [Pirellulales bacterium]|nr:porin [Pirellulales bacterium]
MRVLFGSLLWVVVVSSWLPLASAQSIAPLPPEPYGMQDLAVRPAAVAARPARMDTLDAWTYEVAPARPLDVAVEIDPGYANIARQPSPAPAVNGAYSCGSCCGEQSMCGSVCEPSCGACQYGPCGGACVQRLITPCCLERRKIVLGGWVDQGISALSNQPSDRYNGPVVYNDRDGEYQMNQLYFFLERKTDTRGCGLDIGGRIDFLFGTDARFVGCADGLEANWNQRERFYHAALPQFYLDAAWNNWTVRMGHFYTIIGYEVVQAPENFFYSHPYAFQYGEPLTHTGMLAMYKLTEGLEFSCGFHRGWDQFDDTDGNNRLSVLTGATWTSRDERKKLAFALTSGEQGPGNTTVMYSLVGTLKLTDRLSYVIQHDHGQSKGNGQRVPGMAQWFGLNQYLYYQCSPKWSVGSRIEWFRDEDGVRVHGVGQGNLAVGPYAGDFYEITLGLNWKPHCNIVVRPEVRWDWYNGHSELGAAPFDGGDADQQFMMACDVVIQF